MRDVITEIRESDEDIEIKQMPIEKQFKKRHFRFTLYQTEWGNEYPDKACKD